MKSKSAKFMTKWFLIQIGSRGRSKESGEKFNARVQKIRFDAEKGNQEKVVFQS